MSGDEGTPVTGGQRFRRRGDSTRAAAARILIILGWAFVLVSLADLALLWIPVRIGSVAWEFATVGRTLDALPMPALGLGLLAYGSARHPRIGTGRLRIYAVAFGVLALLLVLLGVLHFTSTLAVLSEAPPEAVDGVRRALIRHGTQAVVYPIAFAVVAVVLLRVES